MKFSDMVKEVRGRLQLTQKQLADKCGVKYYTVNRWEQERHKPSFLVRRKFDDFCKEQGISFEK
ncbi:MAG: helix-turn-helix domain-containing protein [Firmicutes bacterium]|nr:helix-turn-helix domain-containing protein [Bacillota bacterium]